MQMKSLYSFDTTFSPMGKPVSLHTPQGKVVDGKFAVVVRYAQSNAPKYETSTSPPARLTFNFRCRKFFSFSIFGKAKVGYAGHINTSYFSKKLSHVSRMTSRSSCACLYFLRLESFGSGRSLTTAFAAVSCMYMSRFFSASKPGGLAVLSTFAPTDSNAVATDAAASTSRSSTMAQSSSAHTTKEYSFSDCFVGLGNFNCHPREAM
mmetsp:Transcript_24419/g.53754  ORF Transcript_24419/g.53754 Transcript_24419/m.53754 type:complete len:207 (-) Transcript_24419:470-1090(-)